MTSIGPRSGSGTGNAQPPRRVKRTAAKAQLSGYASPSARGLRAGNKPAKQTHSKVPPANTGGVAVLLRAATIRDGPEDSRRGRQGIQIDDSAHDDDGDVDGAQNRPRTAIPQSLD